jgi:hypothetical protein
MLIMLAESRSLRRKLVRHPAHAGERGSQAHDVRDLLEALNDLRDLGQMASLRVEKGFAVEPKLAVTSGLFRFKGKSVAYRISSYP